MSYSTRIGSIFWGFSIWVLVLASAWAQPPGGGPPPIFRIKGQVFDQQTQEAVAYASVRLQSLKDTTRVTGALTDEEGRFELPELRPGLYRLHIQFFGYASYAQDSLLLSPANTPLGVLDLGRILLGLSATTLDEVVLEGEVQALQLSAEKKVFNVDATLAASGGTTEDILRQIPGLMFDSEGNLMLRGNSNITILINGRPSALGNANGGEAPVMQIPATLIERVEIITAPSARYDAEGQGGILNIVLKTERKPGYFGSVGLTGGNGPLAGGQFNFSYGAGPWNLSVGYAYRYTERFRRMGIDRQNIQPDTTFFFDTRNLDISRSQTHNANFALDYRWGEKGASTLTLDGSLNYQSTPAGGQRDYTFLNTSREQAGSSIRTNDELHEGLSGGLGLQYNRVFANNPQHRLTMLGNFSLADHLRTEEFVQSFLPFEPLFIQDKLVDTRHPVWVWQADYLRPLAAGRRLELGWRSTLRETDDEIIGRLWNEAQNAWQIDSGLTNHFIFAEQVHALYGIVAGSLGADKLWEYQLGLRLEQTLSESEQLLTEQRFPRDYFSWFPSLHLSRKIGLPHTVSLMLNRRIQRPNTRSLNPFINFDDPLNLRQGNPFLRPEYTNAAELQYLYQEAKWTVTSSLYYRLNTDQIVRFSTVNPEGVALHSMANLAETHSYGAEAIVVRRWATWLNTTLSVNVFGLYFSEANAALLTASARGVGGYGRFIANINPTKAWGFQLSYDYSAPNPMAQGRMLPIHGMDFGIRYQTLADKLVLNLAVQDAFDTRIHRMQMAGPGFVSDGFFKRQTQIVMLTATWRFGNLDQQPKRPTRQRGDFEGGGMDE
jgi:hypothetical protein